jgi:hypothetical protein
LKEDVEPREPAGGALVFAGLLDSAETDQGATAGFFRRHALFQVFFDSEIEMGCDFGFKVGV